MGQFVMLWRGGKKFILIEAIKVFQQGPTVFILELTIS